MRLAKFLVSASLLGAACSAATVTISQPSASTATSPVQVSATASGSFRVLQLYVDGQKFSETLSSPLNASVPLVAGSHRIAVQAVDWQNQISKTVKYVTVQQVASPPPPPPATGTTFSNLQESSSWQTCGTCGNQSGTTGQAFYSMTRGITNPAIDSLSTSAQFSIGGSIPYTNAYWYLHDTAPKAPVKSLVYEFYLYVPDASATAPQAIEFECQHTVNGYTYNYAWQADYASHQWRTFDFVNRVWVATSIPFSSFAPGIWHHIVAEYHANGNQTVHDALTVDGLRSVVNITRPAKYTGQSWASFTNAFQLDLNSKPTPFNVYVDKMSVTYE
jgi:hypothetical protein